MTLDLANFIIHEATMALIAALVGLSVQSPLKGMVVWMAFLTVDYWVRELCSALKGGGCR